MTSSIRAAQIAPEVVAGAVRLTGRSFTNRGHAGIPVRSLEAAHAGVGDVVEAAVAVAPTQMRRPWRTVLRSVWQSFVGLCLLAPILVEVAGLDVEELPWLVVPLAVAAAVTRAMADPRVEAILRRIPILSWFAAAPPLPPAE